MKYLMLIDLLLFAFTGVNAQENSRLTPDSAINFFNENYPQEKVFLQTDRTQYVSGETIWAKAWCTQSGLPSFLSRILYVDLVNRDGKVIQKKMYKLDSMASVVAAVDINNNVAAGNYVLRAYTLWMLNFPDFIFQKNLYIYNTGYGQTEQPAARNNVQVVFFPEGGDLIAGIRNRVAFKAVKADGFPVEIKGYITDGTDKKILDFSSEHDGIGVFELVPEKGVVYKAAITNADGRQFLYTLPEMKEEGIGLNVENSNTNRLFVVLNRPEKNKDKYNKLRIIAQMHGQRVFDERINLDEGQTTVAINKKKLPPGIMQITVFNETDIPLAERIVFIENYSLGNPVVQYDSIKAGARQQNELSFTLPVMNDVSFSCLVTDASSDTLRGCEDNIVSSILTTSDLQGYIHHPGYYFMDKSPVRLRHLDLLLMTQGWRRFQWTRILHNEFPRLIYPVESAMSISGTVTKSDRREVITAGNVSFIIKGEDSTSVLADASITDKGEFLLDNVNFVKKATISYMGTNKKKENYIVDVKIHPSYFDSLSVAPVNRQVDMDTLFLDNKNNRLASYLNGQLYTRDTLEKGIKNLEGIVVRAKRLSKPDSLNRVYAEGPFLMGKSVDPSEYKFAKTIWQIIQQAVPGVTVEGNPFDPTVRFTRFTGFNSEPEVDEATGVILQENGIAYYLNEINVSKDDINTIAVSDIALIKVLKNEGAALGASQGAIAIYTRKGGVTGGKIFQKTYASMIKEGYAIVKEFYSPDYLTLPDLNKNIKDNRFTLYFGGRLKPRKDGKYHIQFFNNDTVNKYRLIIQGIDKTGRLLYNEQIIGIK